MKRFVGQVWKRNAAYAIAFLTLIFAIVEINQMANSTRDLGYEFVVGDGTITWGKLKRMGPHAAAYRRFLLDVVRVRLQLTPNGLKYPDEASAIFIGSARKTIDQEMPEWLARAGRQNLYADPYLAKIEDLGEVSGHPLFRLSGVVRLSGFAGAMPIIDQEPFFMSLEMAPNPKINRDENADSPFVVLKYQLLLGRAQIERAKEQQQQQQH